jgi:hypothetical protein
MWTLRYIFVLRYNSGAKVRIQMRWILWEIGFEDIQDVRMGYKTQGLWLFRRRPWFPSVTHKHNITLVARVAGIRRASGCDKMHAKISAIRTQAIGVSSFYKTSVCQFLTFLLQHSIVGACSSQPFLDPCRVLQQPLHRPCSEPSTNRRWSMVRAIHQRTSPPLP